MTSCWLQTPPPDAEALRDLGGRMEEMPAEEGFPSYLPSRLAEYYERGGRVKTLGKPERIGSLSLASAVSPPGGDFTEPVTSNTLRFVKVFWPLDVSLAHARHFPAINWLQGFSAYVDLVAKWWNTNIDPKWKEMREIIVNDLIREDQLKQIVRLVGPDSLAEKDKLTLESAKFIKEAFLKQNAFDDIDAFSSPQKMAKIMNALVLFHERGLKLTEKGFSVKDIVEKATPVMTEIIKSKAIIKNNELQKYDELIAKLNSVFDSMEKGGSS